MTPFVPERTAQMHPSGSNASSVAIETRLCVAAESTGSRLAAGRWRQRYRSWRQRPGCSVEQPERDLRSAVHSEETARLSAIARRQIVEIQGFLP